MKNPRRTGKSPKPLLHAMNGMTCPGVAFPRAAQPFAGGSFVPDVLMYPHPVALFPFHSFQCPVIIGVVAVKANCNCKR